MLAKKALSLAKGYAFVLKDVFLIILSFLLSLTVAPLFSLRFANPYEISNPLNPSGFNPENNFISLVFIITLTVCLYYFFQYVYQTRFEFIIKASVIILLLANCFFSTMLHDPGFTTGPQGLDNFHGGEVLSPASEFLNGKDLYSEMVYLRGAGVDAVIPALGFLATGKSIGSFLLQVDMLVLLSLFSFLMFLAVLIRNPIAYGAVSVLFYVSDAVSLLHFRDIFIWLLIGLILYLHKSKIAPKHRAVTLFAIGFISSFTLFVTIDRGLIMLATAGAVAVSQTFLRVNSSNEYKLDTRMIIKNIRYSLIVIYGIIVGIILPALFLGIESTLAFLRLSFLEIPRYGGLLVSQPFPGLFSDRYLIWGPVFVSVVTIMLLVALFKAQRNKSLGSLLPLMYILFLGILCIKAGTNRIDITKMASVITPLFFASTLTLAAAAMTYIKHTETRKTLLVPIGLTLGVLMVFSQLNMQKLLVQPDYTRSQLKNYALMPKTNDTAWISPETHNVKNYILSHTKESDSIFAFTSNPVYYYLTNRTNPSRFYVSWFADPQPYTTELLQSLQRNPPRLVIYSEKTWMDAPDTIPMTDRIPEVDRWITENYKNKVTIGNTTLLLSE